MSDLKGGRFGGNRAVGRGKKIMRIEHNACRLPLAGCLCQGGPAAPIGEVRLLRPQGIPDVVQRRVAVADRRGEACQMGESPCECGRVAEAEPSVLAEQLEEVVVSCAMDAFENDSTAGIKINSPENGLLRHLAGQGMDQFLIIVDNAPGH